MSSILKALKKLEQDRPQKAYPRIWVRNEDNAGGIRNWITGFVAAMLLVGGGAAAYYALGVRSTNTTSDPVAKQGKTIEPSPAKALSSAQVNAKETQVTDIKPALNVKQPRPVEQKDIPMPDKQERIVDLRKQSAPHAAAPVLVRSVPKQPAPTPSPSRKTGAPDKTNRNVPDQEKGPAGPSPQAAATNPKKAPIDQRAADDRGTNTQAPQALPTTPLTDSSLKIQAISWSETPANRMAVVNSQIVRQGESIDGYRIEQINSDDLILSKGGINWILKFVHQ